MAKQLRTTKVRVRFYAGQAVSSHQPLTSPCGLRRARTQAQSGHASI